MCACAHIIEACRATAFYVPSSSLTLWQLRERIINDGAIAPLVKLLHKTEIKEAYRSDAVVAAAAAAVWNLTAQQNAKPIVLRERAVEALVAQLRDSRSPDVWQKCAGCLMVLAANSDKVRLPCIPPLPHSLTLLRLVPFSGEGTLWPRECCVRAHSNCARFRS